MPSSSRNLEKVGEPTARVELVTFALEELREDIRAEQKLTHRRRAGEPYDEPRTQASRLGRRGPARQPSVRAARQHRRSYCRSRLRRSLDPCPPSSRAPRQAEE